MNIPTCAETRRDTFLKPCAITNAAVRFRHNGTEYHLVSPCFKPLEGKTVLVNAAGEVFRSNAKIGDAVPVAAYK